MESDQTTFVTLDTASDVRYSLPSFGEGCEQGADHGPAVRDAQRRPMKFDAVATVPMTAQGERSTHLLKANFRVGETVSKPILSLMEVIDNGAEVWLSKGLMKM